MPKPFAEYLNEKASRMARLLEGVSDREHAKMEAAFSENISRYIGSDEYQAMLADLSIFGDGAFSKRDEQHDDEQA